MQRHELALKQINQETFEEKEKTALLQWVC